MKKLTLIVMAAVVMLFVIPTQLKANTETTPIAVVATAPVATVDASVLVARVEAIKAMDISTLSASERKELRKELRAIKSDLKERKKSDLKIIEGNGGIYLSVGAIIIIILLLILLL